MPTLCGQTTRQTTEQRRRKQVLTDRESTALNQHQQYTRHGSGSQVRTANTKREQNVNDRTTVAAPDERAMIASTRAAGRKN